MPLLPALSCLPPALLRVCSQLLKEQLELQKIRIADGRTRYTIKPIAEQLTFDKGKWERGGAICALVLRTPSREPVACPFCDAA